MEQAAEKTLNPTNIPDVSLGQELKKDTEETKMDLIRNNKHIWFAMANNFRYEKNQPARNEEYLQLTNRSNTYQSYGIKDEIRSLSLNYAGTSLAGCTVTGKVFSLTGKEKSDAIALVQAFGTGIHAVAQHEPDGLVRFFSRRETLDFDLISNKDFGHPLTLPKIKTILTSSNYQWILAKSFKGEVLLMHINTENKCIKSFTSDSALLEKATTFAINSNGTRGLVGYEGSCLILKIDESMYSIIQLLPIYQNVITVDISADGKTGLIAEKERINILNMENLSYRQLSCLPTINAAALSPCGTYVATGHWDGILQLTNVAELWFVNLCQTDETFTCIYFSGDGDTIAAGSDKGIYKISCSTILQSLRKASPLCVSTMVKLFDDKTILANPALLKEFLDGRVINKEQLLKMHDIEPAAIGAEECPICNDHICDITTPCSHSMCDNCYAKSIDFNNQCPFCKHTL